MLLVVAVLASGVVAAYRHPAYVEATRWGPTWRVTTSSLFRLDARPNSWLTDEEIYLGTLQGVRRGVDFYESQNAMFNANAGRWNTRSPLTYRQPLLTRLWQALEDGAWIGIAFAAAAAVAMVTAWFAALCFVRPLPALLAPFGLGLVFAAANLHPPRILYSEMWAGPPIVIAGALCAIGLIGPVFLPAGRRVAWIVDALGAAFALVAMAVRELALIPAAMMATALLLDRRARGRGAWIPWVVAIILWAGLYLRHAARIAEVSSDDPGTSIPQSGLMASYFHPGFRFLSACLRWESTSAIILTLVTVLCLLAIAGLGTLRGPGPRVLAFGSTAGVALLLLLFGTPGTYQDGSYTGYWGFLFVPLVIAWSPLGLRLVPGQSAAASPPRAS